MRESGTFCLLEGGGHAMYGLCLLMMSTSYSLKSWVARWFLYTAELRDETRWITARRYL